MCFYFINIFFSSYAFVLCFGGGFAARSTALSLCMCFVVASPGFGYHTSVDECVLCVM